MVAATGAKLVGSFPIAVILGTLVGNPSSDPAITSVGTAIPEEVDGSLDGEVSSGALVLDETEGSFEGCAFVGMPSTVGPLVID